MVDRKVCIVDGIRTPFVKAAGPLRHVPAYELGRLTITELLDRNDREGLRVDEVIFGNIIGPAEASNISRVMTLNSGLPKQTPAFTLNMNCASGLLSLAQAYDRIASGGARAIIAGGTESMSHAPLHFPKSMSSFLTKMLRSKTLPKKLATLFKLRPSMFKPIITLTQGLTDPVTDLIMGDTAEILAKRYNISREDQDTFALRSHQRYFKAKEAGFYDDHVMPIFVPPKYKEHVAGDIGPRDGLTMAQLAKLRPYFDRKFGTVTVGNSCPITDGAAACLLMETSYARELGFEPEIFVRAYGYQGISPEIMGLGPAVATPVALKKAGVEMRNIELVEINEAFAAQVMAVERVFDSPRLFEELTGETSILTTIDPSRLNVNGGAIALGHPVGTSGTRIVMNLYKEMQRRDANLGLAAICVGGGLGGAMILERN